MHPTIFQSNTENWNRIKSDIIRLENQAFGENAFTPEYLETDFLNSKNIIVVLEKDGEVIGFAYSRPIEETGDGRESEAGETAYGWDLVVDEKYHGQKLGALLMNTMVEEIKKRGYQYIEMCARKANNLASNIEKAYKDSIVDMYDLDSRWGPQKFFRIKL